MSIKNPTLPEQMFLLVLTVTAAFLSGLFHGSCVPTAMICLGMLIVWGIKDRIFSHNPNARHWAEKIPLETLLAITAVALSQCLGGSTSIRGDLPVMIILGMLVGWAITNKADTRILEKNKTILLLLLYILWVCFSDAVNERGAVNSGNLLRGALLTGGLLIFMINNPGTLPIAIYATAFSVIISAIFLRIGIPGNIISLPHKNAVATSGGIALAMAMTQPGMLAFSVRILLTGALMVNESGMGKITAVLIWGVWGIGTAWGSKNKIVKTITLSAIVGTGIYCATHLSKVLALIGKDTSLTGRTNLWQVVPLWTSFKPIFGWGNDFWKEYGGIATENEMQFHPTSGHNAIAHLVPCHGLVGLALFLLLIAYAIKKSPMTWRDRLILLTGFIATNSTEAFGFIYGGGGIVGLWLITAIIGYPNVSPKPLDQDEKTQRTIEGHKP